MPRPRGLCKCKKPTLSWASVAIKTGFLQESQLASEEASSGLRRWSLSLLSGIDCHPGAAPVKPQLVNQAKLGATEATWVPASGLGLFPQTPN